LLICFVLYYKYIILAEYKNLNDTPEGTTYSNS